MREPSEDPDLDPYEDDDFVALLLQASLAPVDPEGPPYPMTLRTTDPLEDVRLQHLDEDWY